MEKTPELLAYLAGFFDGEGCILIARVNHNDKQGKRRYQYYQPRVAVNQKVPGPLPLLKELYGGQFFQAKTRQMYFYVHKLGGALNLVRDFQPYLMVKREQADYILSKAYLWEINTGGKPLDPQIVAEREEVHREMQRLKTLC